jgi:parallel beta-helix repeat protein
MNVDEILVQLLTRGDLTPAQREQLRSRLGQLSSGKTSELITGSVDGNAPITTTISGKTVKVGITKASDIRNGYLSSGDWATFNNKQYDLETANVKAYNAIGNGVTDDAAAIQSAINTSARVFAPTGTYRIASQLTLPSNSVLSGRTRAAIQKDSTAVFHMVRNSDQTNGNTNIVIENIVIDGNAYGKNPSVDANHFAGIHFKKVTNALIRCVEVKNTINAENGLGTPENPNTPAASIFLQQCDNVTIEECYLHDNNVTAIIFESCTNCRVVGNTVRNNGGTAIAVTIDSLSTTGSGIIVDNNIAINNGFTGTGYSAYSINCPDCIVTNNISGSCGGAGYTIGHATSSSGVWYRFHPADRAIFANNYSGNNNGTGVTVAGSDYVKIENNELVDNCSSNIYLYVLSGSAIITGNNIARAKAAHGIYLHTGDNHIVSNNVIRDNVSHGILLGLGNYSVNNCVITNNVITGNTSRGIYANVGSGHLISNNRIYSNAVADIYTPEGGNTIFGNITTGQDRFEVTDQFEDALYNTRTAKNRLLNFTGDNISTVGDLFGSYLALRLKNETQVDDAAKLYFQLLDATESALKSVFKVATYDDGYEKVGAVIGDGKIESYDNTVVNASELITNGTFTTNTSGWSGVNGTIAAVGGQLRITQTGGTTSASAKTGAITTVPGARYRLTAEFYGDTSTGTKTNAQLWAGMSSAGNRLGREVTDNTSGSSVLTLDFVAETTTSYVTLSNTGTSQVLYWDNVKLRMVSGGDVVARGKFAGEGSTVMKFVSSGSADIYDPNILGTTILTGPFTEDDGTGYIDSYSGAMTTTAGNRYRLGAWYYGSLSVNVLGAELWVGTAAQTHDIAEVTATNVGIDQELIADFIAPGTTAYVTLHLKTA